MKHEQAEQCAFVAYLQARKLLFTATLGGIRLTIGQASQLKRQGYGKGVPDILIFEPRGPYHGLCIEMKRRNIPGQPKGRLSIEQEYWINELNKKGYYAAVCEGCYEAIDATQEYLNGKTI